MPRLPYRAPGLEFQVFLGSDAVRKGLLTEHQLRSRAWRRLRQNVYADARLEQDHRLDCRAVALRVPRGVVIAGPSAAYLFGIGHAAGFGDDVHVIAPPSVRVGAQRGVKVHVQEIDPADTVVDAPVPHTTLGRTAFDVAAWLSPAGAVPVIDTMLHRGLVTPADLAQVLRSRAGRRGLTKARVAFGMADPGSSTPAESRLRVRLMRNGVPRPVLRHPIAFDYPSGDPVLLLDMAWPAYRVAIEYDRRRAAMLTAAGWFVLHVPPAPAGGDFPDILHDVRQALFRRGWHSDEPEWALATMRSGIHQRRGAPRRPAIVRAPAARITSEPAESE